MLKMIALLKKRAGMSREEFRDYYEGHHVPLILQQQGPNMLEYRRNYLTGEMINGADDSPFDVITEFLYPDRAAFDRAFARMLSPEATKERTDDEERLFDMPAIRVFIVETRESDCASVETGS
jgi:uncharacterized protein (TIGR02118 family)